MSEDKDLKKRVKEELDKVRGGGGQITKEEADKFAQGFGFPPKTKKKKDGE